MSSTEPRVDPLTRVCYGIGSIAYGIKDNGFGYFLLFYYSQVLGLPSAQASLAIFVALLLDAASDPPAEAAMAKLHGTELQNRATDRCLQLFGGYGFMTEYPIGPAYADARVTTIYGGTSEIMKTIISKDVLK